MTLVLSPLQEQRLNDLASQTARTPDELLREGVDRFLDTEEEFVLAVKQGDEDIAAGRLIEHDEVVARIDRLLEGR